MGKTEVILFILCILLVGTVYSVDINWPDNVPFGESFHGNMYTDMIDDADGDNLIEVNASLDILVGFYSGNGSGLYDLNLTEVTLEDVIFEGFTNFTGEVNIEGDLSVGQNLYVGKDIYSNNIFSEDVIVNGSINASKIFVDNISSGYYCDENGGSCVTLQEIVNGIFVNFPIPGLFDVLNFSADASTFDGLTMFGGKVDAPNFAAKRNDDGEVNYYLENSLGISRIMQDSNGMYIQSGLNKLFFEGQESIDLEEIWFNAETITTPGKLNVGEMINSPQIFQNGNIVCDDSGNNCNYLTFVSVDGTSISGDGRIGNELSIIWPEGINDGDDGIIEELDPEVGYLESGKWCKVNDAGNVIVCEQDQPLMEEEDPEVGTLSEGKWCSAANGAIICTNDQPLHSFTEVDPEVGGLTSGKWCKVNDAGNVIVCEQDQPLMEEEDPEVGTLSEGKWCSAANGAIICTNDQPLHSFTEVDPEVSDDIKDGIDWSELSGIPSGFLDGIDDDTNTYCSSDGSTITCPDGTTLTDTDTDTDTNTNAATACDGTSVYLDGDGNCDTLYTDTDTNTYCSSDGSTITCPDGTTLTDTDTDTDTNTNAATACDGTSVYLDGDGNCDTLYTDTDTNTNTYCSSDGSTITCPDGTTLTDTNSDYCYDGVCGGDLTVFGDVVNLNANGQFGISQNFAFRDEGSSWLRLRNGVGSSDYAMLAVKKIAVTEHIFTMGGAHIGSASNPGTDNLEVDGNIAVDDDVNVGGNVNVGGDVTADHFYYGSDKRLKKEITKIDNALSKVLQLKGVSFKWKKNDEKSIGLIAQDVEKVFPELVNTENETGLKTVDYGSLVSPLIEAIKEQEKEINKLKKEINKLKGYNEKV